MIIATGGRKTGSAGIRGHSRFVVAASGLACVSVPVRRARKRGRLRLRSLFAWTGTELAEQADFLPCTANVAGSQVLANAVAQIQPDDVLLARHPACPPPA